MSSLSSLCCKSLFYIHLILRVQVKAVHTHSCQTAGAFTYCGTAANQANEKQKSPDSYYYDSWNQSVHVLKEVIIVVICDKHIGSDVA